MQFIYSSFTFLFILMLYIWSITESKSVRSRDVFVETTYGKLRGFQIQFIDSQRHNKIKGELVNVFLGIPFAQPPVIQLRFEVVHKVIRMKQLKT